MSPWQLEKYVNVSEWEADPKFDIKCFFFAVISTCMTVNMDTLPVWLLSVAMVQSHFARWTHAALMAPLHLTGC